jgi:hypothetical protein
MFSELNVEETNDDEINEIVTPEDTVDILAYNKCIRNQFN